MATMTPFQRAFRQAKNAGKPDFEFPPGSGKMYTTKTAEEQGREIGATARGSGRSASAGRTAANRDTATTRRAETSMGRAEIPTGGSAKAPAERGERMSPLEMGLLTTAGALAGPALGRGAATAYRGAKDVVDTVRGAVQASRGLEDARRARLAREMDDSLPEPASIPELGRGVFRSAREKAEAEARNAKPRVRVEGTKGGVYRSEAPKTESKAGPEFRSRTADRMDEREMGMKKGGKVKSYATGGSVRGAGIAQRGVKKCRMV
jgi:hypothetical protein